MKKLSKLKLNNLSTEELTEGQMKSIKGGMTSCLGSCYYATAGGSSSGDNCRANLKKGEHGGYSTKGDNTEFCYEH